MNNTGLLLDYSGKFEFKTIETLVKQAKTCIEGLDCKVPVRKKIINICIECLENIHKYSVSEQEDAEFIDNFNTIVKINTTNDLITIETGNTIHNSKIESLKKRIVEINIQNREQLKEKYDKIINNNVFNDKGGAGLGLIDIALKSGNPIDFQFKPIDNKISFFLIKVYINIK
jgi:hypothetical protein